MTIWISKEAREQALASIERYFPENMEETIGNIAAGGLLGAVPDGGRSRSAVAAGQRPCHPEAATDKTAGGTPT